MLPSCFPGVQRAEVSFRDKQARVTFDRDQVSVEQLIDAVSRLGFRASLKIVAHLDRTPCSRPEARFLRLPV